MTIRHHIIFSTLITLIIIVIVVIQHINDNSKQTDVNAIENKTYKTFSEKELKKLRYNYSDITEAILYIDVFDVNGDAYSNKVLYFNGKPIGLLPSNKHPVSQWQTVFIPLPKHILNSISSNNTLGIKDNTKDFYNLKDICLKFKTNKFKKYIIINQTNSYSSAPYWWPYKQGKQIKLDGSAFSTIDINLTNK